MKKWMYCLYPRTLRRFLLVYIGLAIVIMLGVWIWPLVAECRSHPSFFKYFWHAKRVEIVRGGGHFNCLGKGLESFRCVTISDSRPYSLVADICSKCDKAHVTMVSSSRSGIAPIVEVWIKFKNFLGIDFGPIEE